MNEKLQIGVAGCGYWGPNLIRNLVDLPECEVALVCDIDKRRIAHISRLHPGMPTDTNFDKMLNGINLDAIFRDHQGAVYPVTVYTIPLIDLFFNRRNIHFLILIIQL